MVTLLFVLVVLPLALVLIVHPLIAVRTLYASGRVSQGFWVDFSARLVSIGVDPMGPTAKEPGGVPT